MVVKESYYLLADWGKDRLWYEDKDSRIPMESRLAQNVNELDRGHVAVRYCAGVAYEGLHVQRLYLEFCPRGSLEDVIGLHVEARDAEGSTDDG